MSAMKSARKPVAKPSLAPQPQPEAVRQRDARLGDGIALLLWLVGFGVMLVMVLFDTLFGFLRCLWD